MEADIVATAPKPNALAQAFQRGRVLMFEAHAPGYFSKPSTLERKAGELRDKLRTFSEIPYVNVPEVISEQHDGLPKYDTVEPRHFASAVVQGLNTEAVVNRVIVHHPTPGSLVDWVGSTLNMGIRYIVLVGGNSRHQPYPGPSPVEANLVVKEMLEPHGGMVGNISLPNRRKKAEAHRMYWKTKVGAQFFTTQVLFDSEGVTKMLPHYYELCSDLYRPVQPAAIVLSFTPSRDRRDVHFWRQLGADMPETAQRYIFDGGPADQTIERSHRNAIKVYAEVLSSVEASGLPIHLGINVEQSRTDDVDAPLELLRKFIEVKGMHGADILAQMS
jgi:5,10-methylenetetrahydrofolate reductase